ncbi:MAG TPA: hypothetical protein VGV92_09655 [Gammaproteobacteria bacterium]|nr:hypothetical protein [Gammaproteobacteria bacterium]
MMEGAQQSKEPKTLREEIASGLTTFTRKGLNKLASDSSQYHYLFKQLCTLDSDEPLLIALYSFFKYYRESEKDSKLKTSAFLGRLLNIARSRLDENGRHKLNGILLEMTKQKIPDDKQDKQALPTEEARLKYLIKYLNAMYPTMSEYTQSRVNHFEAIFKELLTPSPRFGKEKKHKENQAAIIEALKALFRNDVHLLGLAAKNCSTDTQAHLFALEPSAKKHVPLNTLEEVPHDLYVDLINPKSRLIHALDDYYSNRTVLGADLLVVGEKVHARVEFQELAGVLARIGKTNPVGMLNCLVVIINIFLNNPDNNLYVTRKLKSSGLLGRLLNATSSLTMSANQRYEFEQLKAKSRHWTGDDDKALKPADRIKYLTLLRDEIVHTVSLLPAEDETEESILESGCPELKALFENAIIKNRTSANHAERRANTFSAIEAFFALKADPENREKIEAFTARKNACASEDKMELNNLARQLPAQTSKAAATSSTPGTPVLPQRERARVVRAGSGADDFAIPAAILDREKTEQEKRDAVGRKSFVASRTSGRGNGPLDSPKASPLMGRRGTSQTAAPPTTPVANSPAVTRKQEDERRSGMSLSRDSSKK